MSLSERVMGTVDSTNLRAVNGNGENVKDYKIAILKNISLYRSVQVFAIARNASIRPYYYTK